MLLFSFNLSPHTVLSQEQNENMIHIMFLHGMPETPDVLMPLKERINSLFTSKDIILDFWYPHLSDTESAEVWASNIADEIQKWDPSGKIVLIGLSMGGKSAVHLTAHEKYGVQDWIDSVITINTPLKSFNNFFNAYTGYHYPQIFLPLVGKSLMGYETPDGFIDIVTFDSSEEANWIASEKQLLCFISGEPNPTHPLFDDVRGEMFPRVMDDGAVPLPAQYTSKANVVYYGFKQHEAVFRDLEEAGSCDIIASTIVDFLLGLSIERSCEVFNGSLIVGRKHWFDEDEFTISLGNTKELNAIRDHFEIQIHSDSSLVQKAEISADWSSEKKSDHSITIKISNLFPFSSIRLDYKIFEKQNVTRDSYFS